MPEDLLSKGSNEAPVPMWAFEARNTATDRFLDEVDRRYQQRFESQQHATELALTAAREEFTEHLIQYRREVDQAFAASEKAIEKSESAYDKRFDGVNEFRAQLRDQQADFVSRSYYEARHTSVDEAIQAIQIAMKDLMTRAEANATFSSIAVERGNLRKEIADLRESRSGVEGGSAALWRAATFAVSVVALLVTIYLIVHH